MAGGEKPYWRNDGKEIVYLGPDNKLMAVEGIPSATDFQVGASTALFAIQSYPAGAGYRQNLVGPNLVPGESDILVADHGSHFMGRAAKDFSASSIAEISWLARPRRRR
jgi:hypothetical protein